MQLPLFDAGERRGVAVDRARNRFGYDAVHLATTIRNRFGYDAVHLATTILGLPAPTLIGGKFFAVRLSGDVSLDFDTTEGEIVAQHYAFAVSAGDFDAILARVRTRKLPFWADPQRTRPNAVAERGRGERAFYFAEPSGHWLEVLTK